MHSRDIFQALLVVFAGHEMFVCHTALNKNYLQLLSLTGTSWENVTDNFYNIYTSFQSRPRFILLIEYSLISFSIEQYTNRKLQPLSEIYLSGITEGLFNRAIRTFHSGKHEFPRQVYYIFQFWAVFIRISFQIIDEKNCPKNRRIEIKKYRMLKIKLTIKKLNVLIQFDN